MQQSQSSSTAEFMALFRALETARGPHARLFDDPFAARLLRPPLRQVAELAAAPRFEQLCCRLLDGLWPGAREAGVARTRRIDDALLEATEAGFEQLVMLGVGFDCRAYRLPALASLRVYEVDRPATLAERRRRLAECGAAPLAELRSVPVDFERDVLAAELAEAGFDASRPCVFLLEGVTNYLSEGAVDGLLRWIGSCAPGSRLIFTYVHRDVIERPDRHTGTWLLRRTLRRSAESWSFGILPDELADFLKPHGLVLLRDEGSLAYRQRLLGARGARQRGYEFYRLAIADVAGPGRADAEGQ